MLARNGTRSRVHCARSRALRKKSAMACNDVHYSEIIACDRARDRMQCTRSRAIACKCTTPMPRNFCLSYASRWTGNIRRGNPCFSIHTLRSKYTPHCKYTLSLSYHTTFLSLTFVIDSSTAYRAVYRAIRTSRQLYVLIDFYAHIR